MRRLVPLLFATLAFAQNDTVFRATTELVRVDVAAEDKNGKPVTDLTKDDFELKVNGNPQTIGTFTVASDLPLPPHDDCRAERSKQQTCRCRSGARPVYHFPAGLAQYKLPVAIVGASAASEDAF